MKVQPQSINFGGTQSSYCTLGNEEDSVFCHDNLDSLDSNEKAEIGCSAEIAEMFV